MLFFADIFYFYAFTYTYYEYQSYEAIKRDEIIIRWCDLGIINEGNY